MARKVDASLLADLNKGAENQEVHRGGFSRTTDPKFPVFSTPVNKDILVYIPTLNVRTTENGSEMNIMTVHTHNYKEGKYSNMLRCISGLEGGAFTEVLGYDGTCPLCEATKDCWELYNRKMKAEAEKLGIDPQNDPNDALKGTRQKLLSEMAVSGSEEYVTFPVVIIPTQEKSIAPAPDAMSNLQVQFVVWTKKRYEKNIIGALDSLMTNPGHPGGMFWIWKFSYDTGGKPANARDSAKNAKYMPITDGDFLSRMAPAKPALDKAAEAFTNEKAAEVIISNQYMYKEDLEVKVNKIMASTRQLLLMSENGSLEGMSKNSISAPAEANPLASFGLAAPNANATPNFGEAN